MSEYRTGDSPINDEQEKVMNEAEDIVNDVLNPPQENEEGQEKEGMGSFNKRSLEQMSIKNPEQLGNAIQGMMSMEGDEVSNPSSVSEAFGPIL